MNFPQADPEAIFKCTIAGELMLESKSALLSHEAMLVMALADGRTSVQLLTTALPQVKDVAGLCAGLESNGLLVRVLPEFRKRLATDEAAFDDTMPPPPLDDDDATHQ
ncbi:MAG: hypothetical protein KGJ44_08595 [Betaproteobacteria bacterium]|nr:hypothetical protein [Betaproteobacteria bacterium]